VAANQEPAAQITNGAAGVLVLDKAHAVQANNNPKAVVIVEVNQELVAQITNGAAGIHAQAKAHAHQVNNNLRAVAMEEQDTVPVQVPVHGVVGVLVREVENVHQVQQVRQAVEQMLVYVLLALNPEHAKVIIIGVLGEVVQELALLQKFVTVWIMIAMAQQMKEEYAVQVYLEYLTRQLMRIPG